MTFASALRHVGPRYVAATVFLVVIIAITSATNGVRTSHATSTSTLSISAPPTRLVPALGSRWFALGTSVPYLNRGCDVGCGVGNGIRGNRDAIDRMFRTMAARGVRVARWQLLVDNAPQITRTADGRPLQLDPTTLADMDELIRLAAKQDVYLLPVIFPDPTRLPTSWWTDPVQHAELVAALRPLIARATRSPNVIGWEIATNPTALVDSGVVNVAQLRASLATDIAAVHQAAPGRVAAVGLPGAGRIRDVTGLGANLFVVTDSAPGGIDCARCRLASALGADAPILIDAQRAADAHTTAELLRTYAANGYAGMLLPSWRERSAGSDDAMWHAAYSEQRAGPHARPLNPCQGPRASTFACPNLRMSPPSNLFPGRRGRRVVLFSRNSINSVGRGPASLHGTRNGRLTMSAVQLLHRKVGRRPLVIRTGAKLLFKAIPGQYRYWKWNGAAHMELWRLDASGTPVELTRIGPKTVYCLRDLRRTNPRLAGSPRARVFPGCSQDLRQRSVTLGTSVGWSDIYPSTYFENWVDVTGLRGCFAYVHVVDPGNVIYESNEDDNTSRVVVRLPFTGSNRGCPGARPLPVTGNNGGY